MMVPAITLVAALTEAGHRLHARALLPDDRYRLRALVSQWIADGDVDGVLVTGGTGFTGRDSTPEALLPLLDKTMPGFGELFRAISFEEIGTSSLQSRAFAGLANETFVFALPGLDVRVPHGVGADHPRATGRDHATVQPRDAASTPQGVRCRR